MLSIGINEDACEAIQENIDYTIEDEGIGYYEYGDGEYTDVNMQMRIVPDVIQLRYEHHIEQYIPVMFIGYVTDSDSDMDCGWRADMMSCEWDEDSKSWKVEYDVVED
jgi:hypothetical protein